MYELDGTLPTHDNINSEFPGLCLLIIVLVAYSGIKQPLGRQSTEESKSGYISGQQFSLCSFDVKLFRTWFKKMISMKNHNIFLVLESYLL